MGLSAYTIGDLADGVLISIFCLLDKRSVVRSQAVCKRWRKLAGDLEVRKTIFMKNWGVSAVIGHPRIDNSMELACLASFVYRHRLGPRDTLPSLALSYDCDVIQLRMTNGLSSDHALTNRRYIYVPAQDIDSIKEKTVHFCYIDEACREVFVILSPAGEMADFEALTDALNGHEKRGHEYHGTVFGGMRHMKPRLTARVSKGSQVDSETARYYLIEADWNEVAAGSLAATDSNWAEANPQEPLSGRKAGGSEMPPWWPLFLWICPQVRKRRAVEQVGDSEHLGSRHQKLDRRFSEFLQAV